jgi:hypothetical protein
MEILRPNLLNTTTAIRVYSNTDTAQYILNPDLTYKYFSDGYSTDGVNVIVNISLTASNSIDRIVLMGINAKAFTIYRGGTTTIMTLQGADTTTANWSSNSQTSMFLRFATVSVSQINIVMSSTMVANQEKELGYVYVGGKQLTLDPLPSSSEFSPLLDAKQVIHQMGDGRIRTYTRNRKKTAKLSLKNISSTMQESLKVIYDWRQEMYFAPFGTSTGWDGFFMECVWTGNFDFYRVTENGSTSYFEGSIDLRETSY